MSEIGYRIGNGKAIVISLVDEKELPSDVPCVKVDGDWQEKPEFVGQGFRTILDLVFNNGAQLDLTDVATQNILKEKYQLAFKKHGTVQEKERLKHLVKLTQNMSMLSIIDDDDYRSYMKERFK